MFGIELPEMILIIAVALIVVGPDKLPALAKTLARQAAELKRAANTLKDTLNEEDNSVMSVEQVAPKQFLELTAESAQALPGDQWVHEQDPDEAAMPHQKIPVEMGLTA